MDWQARGHASLTSSSSHTLGVVCRVAWYHAQGWPSWAGSREQANRRTRVESNVSVVTPRPRLGSGATTQQATLSPEPRTLNPEP
eukprot:3030288-Rhodomonas_salina.2